MYVWAVVKSLSEEIDKEKIKKEFVDLIPEQKDYDEKFKNLEKKLEQALTKKPESEHGVLDEFPHAHETKHEHRTHSYDKTCPDCGKDNPDFEPDQYLCSSCGEPVGTKEEAIKSVACPHCGKNEGAENKAEGITF